MQRDKVFHFLACFCITLVLGPCAGIAAGLGKECLDEASKRFPNLRFWIVQGSGWGWLDLAADGLGVTCGMLVNYLLGVM